ncbi:VOC family protein [Marinicella sp. W31]|uniref:VOC family protein n=1 Tax=Marinicella sp. W31 TaxID=3023713 RepID=UPI00375757CE
MKISLVSIPVHDPLEAHEIYTSKLGFVSKQFDPETKIAIVASPEAQNETTLLLEPCVGTFYEGFQKKAFETNLPVIIFSAKNVASELKRLEAAGIKIRPDLDKPEWGLQNMFEDGCGNLIMIEEKP